MVSETVPCVFREQLYKVYYIPCYNLLYYTITNWFIEMRNICLVQPSVQIKWSIIIDTFKNAFKDLIFVGVDYKVLNDSNSTLK